MDEENNFDAVVDGIGSSGQSAPPSDFNFGSFDFGPGAFNISNYQPTYTPQPVDMGPVNWGSLDAGPGAMQLSSVDQAYLNQLNGGLPPEKSFGDYAKEYGPYLLSANPLAAILINKLAQAAGDYAGGGTEGNLVSSGAANLLSGSSAQDAFKNAALSTISGETSQGISNLLPKSENPSLAEEFINRAAPNVGAQLVTALLTGNAGSLAPMVRNTLLSTGKNMAGNKVFGSLTGD